MYLDDTYMKDFVFSLCICSKSLRSKNSIVSVSDPIECVFSKILIL